MDKKFVIAVLAFTVIILIGGVFFLSSSSQKATLGSTSGAKIETPHNAFEFNNISYSGGNVEHGFPIKNVGSNDVTIANLSTSCMCTQAFLKSKEGEGPKFGMKGHSSQSSWTGKLSPGEEGQIVVIFDPTAHGPGGVGAVARSISFETNDPDHPYVELSFTGNVIK